MQTNLLFSFLALCSNFRDTLFSCHLLVSGGESHIHGFETVTDGRSLRWRPRMNNCLSFYVISWNNKTNKRLNNRTIRHTLD